MDTSSGARLLGLYPFMLAVGWIMRRPTAIDYDLVVCIVDHMIAKSLVFNKGVIAAVDGVTRALLLAGAVE